MTESGTLYIVGTPIGNREDITLRALRTLAACEVIVCEDTRVTSRLLSLYDDQLWDLVGGKPKKPHLTRLDEAFEQRMIPKIVDWLMTGTNVALVTDAGMPCVSDPGWRVVNVVREQKLPVEVIPGPSALTTVMAGVGMDTTRVGFFGFLPKKPGKQREMIEKIVLELTNEFITMAVIYESPNRLEATLQEIPQDMKVAVCGELTKTHERILRGTVREVMEQLPTEIKGEWVIVIGK
jgi:16S rRNA (cytidine1402-2'-O)-methyltransferase